MYLLGEGLLNLPDVVGLEEFGEVVILLCCLDFFYLLVDGIVISRSFDIADDTECYGETIAITHEGELELEGVVLTVSIVNEDILLCDAVLAYLDNLQSKAFLHQSELAVLTEDEGFAVLNVDGVLGSACLVIDSSMSAIVEDNAVLQHLYDRSALVSVGCLQHLNGVGTISSYGTCEEVTACAEAKLCRTEGIFHCAVR